MSPRPRPREMFLLQGPDGIDDVLAKLKVGPLAIDTETTGLKWKRDLVGSINLAAGETAVFAYRDALAPIVRWLARQIKHKRSFVFHHAKFDMHMLWGTFGLHFPDPVHDTRIQSRILDNRGVGTSFNPMHGLKDLARVFVDPHANDAERELMSAIKAVGGKHKGDWLLAPRKFYAKYSALDPWYTLQLHEQFISRLRHWAQPEGYPSLMSLYHTEQWLTLALRDMEQRGIRVSRKYLQAWQYQLRYDMEDTHRELVDAAGRDINWNSPPQLRNLLYGKRSDGGLGLKPTRRTKSGKNDSADKTALVALNHPVGAALLRYRKLNHACNVGAQSILDAIEDDGAVHCSFNQIVDTGRMSCEDPNLQGQDRTSGVRKGFRPRKGLVLRMADYSQVEMRFASHYANEPFLVQKFNEEDNFDAHTATAMRMFGQTEVSSNQRKYAKDVNFATIYGAGEEKQTEMLMTRVTLEEARQACRDMGYVPSVAESPHRALVALLREKYQEMMPAMRKCARQEAQICEQRGFVVNAYGRLRYLDEDESYKAFNTKIQGTAADRAKRGLVAVYRELQLNKGELALLLQIHDEIIYESEGDPRTDRRVLELLNDLDTFRVPIIADMSGSDKNWQAKETIHLPIKKRRAA